MITRVGQCGLYRDLFELQVISDKGRCSSDSSRAQFRVFRLLSLRRTKFKSSVCLNPYSLPQPLWFASTSMVSPNPYGFPYGFPRRPMVSHETIGGRESRPPGRHKLAGLALPAAASRQDNARIPPDLGFSGPCAACLQRTRSAVTLHTRVGPRPSARPLAGSAAIRRLPESAAGSAALRGLRCHSGTADTPPRTSESGCRRLDSET